LDYNQPSGLGRLMHVVKTVAVVCSAMKCCTSLQNFLTPVVEACLSVDTTTKEDQNRDSFISSKYMYIYLGCIQMSFDCMCIASAHLHRVRVEIKTAASDFGCALVVHVHVYDFVPTCTNYKKYLHVISLTCSAEICTCLCSRSSPNRHILPRDASHFLNTA